MPRLRLINPNSPLTTITLPDVIGKMTLGRRALFMPVNLAICAAVAPEEWQVEIVDECVQESNHVPRADVEVVGLLDIVEENARKRREDFGLEKAVVGAALLSLSRAKGVTRPAIGCFLDTISSFPALLVDAGANSDCRPEHLLEFARLGTIYSRNLLNIESPRVGLLSNGAEDGKGNRLIQQSYELLKDAEDINFTGNIEGHDIVKRTTDVIVTDGFTGNIVLKTIEGFSDNFLMSVRQIGHVFSSAYRLRGRDLLRDIGLSSWAQKLDYTEYGGACLLGVNGNVIIAHGRSQAMAIRNAIGLAKETAERNITEKFGERKNE